MIAKPEAFHISEKSSWEASNALSVNSRSLASRGRTRHQPRLRKQSPILALTMRPVLLLTLAALSTFAQDHHVVVISIDGFPASILRDPTLPFTTLRRLAREGASAEGMTPVNPTVTWPNHTAIISGVGPSQHGVLFNGLPVRDGEGKSLRIEPWVDKKKLALAPTLPHPPPTPRLPTAH